MSCHVWKNEIKLQNIVYKYLSSSMNVCVSDRPKHNSRSEASFFYSKTQKNHRNGFENKLVLSSLSSFWPFCFPLFLCVCVCAAKGPTRLCGHYCKSTLTRCWLRLGGRVWNVARLLPFFFPPFLLQGRRPSHAFSFCVCVQTRLVPLYYGFRIITMHLGDLCHCVCGISHSV